jgi:hypothetical protein
MQNLTTYKLEVFLPEEALPSVMEALHQAGAGVIGNYDHCFAWSSVNGSWRPLPGAQPYLGEVGQISQSSECKLEVNCAAEKIKDAIAAVRRVHPYEEPLINVIPLANGEF